MPDMREGGLGTAACYLTVERLALQAGVESPFWDESLLMGAKDIPVWEKYTLTMENVRYFRIGEGKLRRLASEMPPPDWVVMNGNRVQVKRKAFERFIDATDVI